MLSAAKSKIAPIVASGENLCGYYNGTPSIRPASGRENLVVLTVVLLTGFTNKRMCGLLPVWATKKVVLIKAWSYSGVPLYVFFVGIYCSRITNK